jgi:hypothetical protein
MSPAELDKIAAKCDREFVINESLPLTPEMRRQHAAARKRERPPVGRGAKRVLVTIEAGVLSEIDALVRGKRLTRAQVIAQGLRMVLAGDRRAG